MRRFVLETYQSAPAAAKLEPRMQRLGEATQPLSGVPFLRLVRVLAFPADELCFYVCEAESAELVAAGACCAGLTFERISEVLEFEPLKRGVS